MSTTPSFSYSRESLPGKPTASNAPAAMVELSKKANADPRRSPSPSEAVNGHMTRSAACWAGPRLKTYMAPVLLLETAEVAFSAPMSRSMMPSLLTSPAANADPNAALGPGLSDPRTALLNCAWYLDTSATCVTLPARVISIRNTMPAPAKEWGAPTATRAEFASTLRSTRAREAPNRAPAGSCESPGIPRCSTACVCRTDPLECKARKNTAPSGELD